MFALEVVLIVIWLKRWSHDIAPIVAHLFVSEMQWMSGNRSQQMFARGQVQTSPESSDSRKGCVYHRRGLAVLLQPCRSTRILESLLL
ncbi:uncharacterized protein CTRU02_214087 [Colletotrichum truncatum]|uniref:Uncharacterized protein n=1 Tax=Colletotrichum truncatum TaxID=5467 RepID=A0ACC3YJH6_COLTU